MWYISGPYMSKDMLFWLQAGYFNDGLQLKTENEPNYHTLGEWSQLLGTVCIFLYNLLAWQLLFSAPIQYACALTGCDDCSDELNAASRSNDDGSTWTSKSIPTTGDKIKFILLQFFINLFFRCRCVSHHSFQCRFSIKWIKMDHQWVLKCILSHHRSQSTLDLCPIPQIPRTK